MEKSAKPVGDARLVEIVRRHLELDSITDGEADESFAHLAGDVGQHLMLVVQLHAEHRARQHGHHVAFHFYMFFHESFTAAPTGESGLICNLKNDTANKKGPGRCRSESHTRFGQFYDLVTVAVIAPTAPSTPPT